MSRRKKKDRRSSAPAPKLRRRRQATFSRASFHKHLQLHVPPTQGIDKPPRQHEPIPNKHAEKSDPRGFNNLAKPILSTPRRLSNNHPHNHKIYHKTPTHSRETQQKAETNDTDNNHIHRAHSTTNATYTATNTRRSGQAHDTACFYYAQDFRAR